MKKAEMATKITELKLDIEKLQASRNQENVLREKFTNDAIAASERLKKMRGAIEANVNQDVDLRKLANGKFVSEKVRTALTTVADYIEGRVSVLEELAYEFGIECPGRRAGQNPRKIGP